MASVKVSCPSCEATVLVKDPKLIGSKVECPKCKYRFKAEAPAEPTADGPAPAAAGKKKAAKAAKGEGGGRNKKLLLGVGAAVAAVALLGIGGYVLFGGGDDKKPSGGGTAGGPRPAAGTKGTTAPKAGGDEAGDGKEEGKEDAPKVPAAPPLARSDKDPTNLLPNDSVAVYRFDLRKLRQSPIGQQLFDPAVVDLMRTATGLEPAQLDRYIHCVVGEEKRAPFGVLRLREPVREADLVGRLAGVGPAAKVNGKDLHPVSGNPFLAAVGNALSARSVLGDLYEAPYAAAAGEKTAPDRAAPLGACAYDTQTLLVGDYATVERFLAGLKDGYPDFLTEFRREALPPPPGEEAEEDDTPAKKDAGKKDAGKKDPKEPAPPPKAAPAGPAREFTANPTYLSVTPELKQLLNTLEADPPPTGSSLVLMAERWDDARYPRAGVKKEYEPVVRVVDAVLSKTRYLGATLWSLEHRRLVGTVRILTTNPEEARSLALDKIGPGLEKGATLLGLMLSNPIAVRNEAAPTQPKDGGAPGAGFPGRLTGPGGFGGPPGMTGPPPGLGGLVGAGPPGGPTGPGRLTRPPPGLGGPPGMTGPPPGMTGGSMTMMGGPSGMMGPPGMFGGSGGYGAGRRPAGGLGETPGAPGGDDAGGPGQPDGKGPNPGEEFNPSLEPPLDPPHLDLRLADSMITIHAELNWPGEVFGGVVAPRLFGLVNQVKGKAAVYAGRHTWHALAGAVSKYVADKGAYPPGTSPSGKAEKGRLQLPYDPGRRVSFFAELLPYLGRDGVARGLDRSQAWFGGDKSQNLIAAEAWVPELLVPYYPPSAWRATSPWAPAHTFGGTNYVAVAGVGADAARYDPKDPAVKDKLGITGYDWGSKAAEVTDGPANTIYLLQVPPGLSRPWAAGGGATVMGLDPADPMAAFRYKRADGQEGTYAIMGDGTVRWIPADIDPKVFLAMATRAGGEKLPNLDEVAPRVAPPGKADKETPAKPEPAKLDPLPDDPKPAAPAAADGAKRDAAPPPREKATVPGKE